MAQSARPNLLVIMTDQERQRRWMGDLPLPHRQRMFDRGLEFTNYYTNSSPCSPARASFITGLYPAQHGVTGNVGYRDGGPKGYATRPQELDPSIPTFGHRLRELGYYTAYFGKWHLSATRKPNMESYGFSDWEGDDLQFTGFVSMGVMGDPKVTQLATNWLRNRRAQDKGRPWLLVLDLVNPHDIAWYPVDHEWWQQANPDRAQQSRRDFESWGLDWMDDPLPAVPNDAYPRVFDELSPNFWDALHTKPEAHRQFAWDWNHGRMGNLDPDDRDTWLRMLDYYYWLHQKVDVEVGLVLDALEDSGFADTTMTFYTSDHGEMAGSHGLRGKGPFVYEENLNIPLYVTGPDVPPGTVTTALGSHVDFAPTLLSLAGGSPQDADIPGTDLSRVLRDPTEPGASQVRFDIDLGWAPGTAATRYALRGSFDGRYKYAHYFGVDEAPAQVGRGEDPPKRFGPDAPFVYQDHELYDLEADPFELRNLAMDVDRQGEIRERFEETRSWEAETL